jgi:hypothetical protein
MAAKISVRLRTRTTTSHRHPSFAEMKTRAPVVAGDKDASPYLSTRGADWRADPYEHSPGPKDLLALAGESMGWGVLRGMI